LINKVEQIAYFSMEIGLDAHLPTYSGGLGVLAGDTIKSFADLGVPVTAITLLSEEGFFHQEIDQSGWQLEIPVKWDKNEFLQHINEKVKIFIEGREVYVGAWKRTIIGTTGKEVSVIFLDTNLPENSEWDRNLTKRLYGGDNWYRLCQELILGIAGVRMLRKLGFNFAGEKNVIHKYHMNEGHASFLTLELMNESKKSHLNENENFHLQNVRKRCVFTTHTPIPAGHDSFKIEDVRRAIEPNLFNTDSSFIINNKFSMTHLALHFSSHINGVAKKHKEVSQKMFPGYSIDSITNGVHSPTWTGPSFKKLFDKYIPGWRRDSFTLRYSLNIPSNEIWDAHMNQKKNLIDFVNKNTNKGFEYNVLTIGFARRVASYKRINFLLKDIERLKSINKKGKIQIILAGKAHPNDIQGKELIRETINTINSLNDEIKIAFLPNYEMWLGQLMISGVDLWLNTPMRPHEASGTSGMKAAHNGVLNFSILDGWWIEGCVEGITGWSIGPKANSCEDFVDEKLEINDLYYKLENKIIPLYYKNREGWIKMMLHSISHNASFFNTQRMVTQYITNCYFL